ncbi:MAG: hypothetical protein ACSLFR_02840 [Solirubrobacteraceae bacterium]
MADLECDASAIPANVGVDPSPTITAMAERFAAREAARGADSAADPAKIEA